MASRDLCREIIGNLTGKQVTDDQVRRLERVVSRHADAIMKRFPATLPNDAITEAAERAVAGVQRRAQEQKRVALLNEVKRRRAQEGIEANWGNQLGLGLRSLVTGTQRGAVGARVSAAGQQDAVRAYLVGGFHAQLAKLGRDDLRLFLADAVEDDIARGLWHLARDTVDEAAFARLDPAAQRIARVVHDTQELARGLANKEGADIGRYAGYVFRATHHVDAIAGDELGWRSTAMETFDLDRMMGEMGFDDPESMVDSLFTTFSTGLHLKHAAQEAPLPYITSANVANRLSQSKVVHFKNAEAFLAYNRMYGYGNLRESVIRGLEHSAQNIGLMQVLGTNPGVFIDTLEEQLAKSLKKGPASAAEVKRFRSDVQGARRRLAEVDGSLNIPGNATGATYSQALRSLQTMASLGGSLISSFSDLGLFVVSARHNGINAFQAAGAAVGGLFKGKGRAEQIEMASALGVVFESLAGKMSSRFSTDDGGRGAIAAAQQLFFKLNFQTWWTDSLRFAAAEMLSHNLAGHAPRGFGELPPSLARTLSLYGVDEAAWDVARRSVQTAEDGRAFLTADGIPDEQVSRALRAYFTDQNGYLLLSPDSETRFLTKMGTQKGTVAGEAIRFMMQFKSFSIAFSQKMLGRELLSHIDTDVRGAGVFSKAMGNGSALLGLSQVVVTSTLMGYLSMTMKDMLRGREPRDPSDPRTALAAMQQGGGLGIMGDFLFGQQNRAGGGFIGTIVGPTAGDVESLAGLYFTAREAAMDPEKEAEFGDKLFRLTYSNVPGNNLFWVKPILEYLFLWNLQETLNPGAMKRMERNAAKQGQEFFISPSERVAEQQRSSQ